MNSIIIQIRSVDPKDQHPEGIDLDIYSKYNYNINGEINGTKSIPDEFSDTYETKGRI